MANPVCEVQLTEDPLQLPEQQCCGTGAVVDFFGVVRPLELNQEISGIDYQAHESMALHQLEVIARDAIAKFALDSAIVYHRIGFVAAGEASVGPCAACVVGCPGRAPSPAGAAAAALEV